MCIRMQTIIAITRGKYMIYIIYTWYIHDTYNVMRNSRIIVAIFFIPTVVQYRIKGIRNTWY